jgi:hypothetical protein
MNDVKLLFEMLRHHPFSREAVARGAKPWLEMLGIDPLQRAKILAEDMTSIECDWTVRSKCVDGFVLSHYIIPKSDFGKMNEVNQKSSPPETYMGEGTGLTEGSLVRLSKASVIGRKLFGDAWPIRFKKALLNGIDHLSFLEELFWLNRWHHITDIEYEATPFKSDGCGHSIDWRLKSCGKIINLEVKFRPKDWMRSVDGPEHNKVMPSIFEGVSKKFPKNNKGELNLVAVSCMAPIDRSMREVTEQFLREHPTINGVLVWSMGGSTNGPAYEISSLNDRELIQALFAGIDAEAAHYIGSVSYPMRVSEERRSLKSDEVADWLHKHF